MMEDRTPEQIRSDILMNIIPWAIGYFVIGLTAWLLCTAFYLIVASDRRDVEEALDLSYAFIIPAWPILVIVAPFYAIEFLLERLKVAIIRWKGFE
jgi:ABC-type Na+ efflux pump permease subunit